MTTQTGRDDYTVLDGWGAEARCSRCGRPYSEHTHRAEEATPAGEGQRFAGYRFEQHAYRSQPVNREDHYGNWVSVFLWPDGRWDR